ncbi:helix-turn-helix domain-containing protein [Gluconobacter sp. LMG 1745]|uniref:Helix-turn-helix domain-containing protein n=1 Tax=Gluconobacter cadivus TaxID=2728101 RepID=A0ABR9YT65_9PROT|nr:helix-turn-helix domain-containing protein [Gluconobacter cadivus]
MSGALLPVKLLRVTTVAERWDVSKQSVHNLIRSGKLAAISIGASKRIHPDEVAKYEKMHWHAQDQTAHPTVSPNGTAASMSNGGTGNRRSAFLSGRQTAKKPSVH